MYLSYRTIVNKFKMNIRYRKIFEYQVYMTGLTWFNITMIGNVITANTNNNNA